nr:ribosomal protein L5 [Ostreobium quekettii]
MVQRLKKYYFDKVVPKLMATSQLNYKNKQQVPRVQKIVVNRGLGDASQNEQILKSSLQELSFISGQKGIITRSKKSIAGFKIRKKMPVGICVTLRDNYMYGFLDRLINLALPRIRDFRGLKIQSFDGKGNYTLGLEEQLMFPEINYDKIHQIRGMDISIITNSKTDQETFYLLQNFGFPFQKNGKKLKFNLND